MRKGFAILQSARLQFFCYEWIRKPLTAIAWYGVANEKDESNQKYIIQMNLVGIATFIINLLTGILFIIVVDWSPGISFIVTGSFWLLPIYYNRNGLIIISRVLPVFLTLIAIFLASCWYLHHTLLGTYYLIVAINSTFMYSFRERKWQSITVILALLLFIVEFTPLQSYLPDYYTLKVSQPLKMILVFGIIVNTLVDLIIYAYINHLREQNLLTKQRELEATQVKVQIQNEDLKTFSIAASHTIQTPLHVSTFFLEKMESELQGTINAETKSNISLIRNGLLQIDQLVSGLFSYNRIINIENELKRFDVIEEMDMVRKGIKLKYPDAKINIKQVAFYITANPLLFSTVVYNLIDNGIKYNVSTKPEVTINWKKTETSFVLIVRDNGIGIPEKYFATIFEPFKRIQKDQEFKPGNGLGLACAKRAAERMGGNLTCQESNNSGSVFKLELPFI